MSACRYIVTKANLPTISLSSEIGKTGGNLLFTTVFPDMLGLLSNEVGVSKSKLVSMLAYLLQTAIKTN